MAKRIRKPAVDAIGIDIGDKYSELCVLDRSGTVLEKTRIATVKSAFAERFLHCARVPIALEAGTHSPWIARLLEGMGHDAVVANPRKVALISQNNNKHDRADAELLARLVRVDRSLLSPVKHRSEDLDEARGLLRAREVVVRARAQMINHVRCAVKSTGARLPRCSAEVFATKVRDELPKELRRALMPLLDLIAAQTVQVRAFDKDVDQLGKSRFPVTQVLQTIPGVGPITSLAFVTAIADPARFKKSRTVGAYLGLRPRRNESGESAPELRITKAGDGFVRKLLVQASHCHLARGPDSALKRWGMSIAGRGRKNAKKRAIVAVARKLAVIMHRLWTTGEVYQPFPGGIGA